MTVESVFIKKLLAKIFAQIGTAAWKHTRSKSVRMIQILKPFGLNKLKNDFKSIYAHTIADLAAEGEPKPVLKLFEKDEIKTAFENHLIEPKENGEFQQSVTEAIEIYALGDDIKGLGLSSKDITSKFTSIFKFYVKKADPGHALLSNEHKQLSNEHKQLENLLLEQSSFFKTETIFPVLPLTPPIKFAHARHLEKFWVGREDELTQLIEWYQDEAVKVIGLVGFGGVGKSTMTRKWLEGLQADGIFWWCFYRENSLDTFLESALKYFSGGQFNPEEARSSYARIRKLLEYITHGRFILVLDGLEDMQKADDRGENFGEMKEMAFTDLLQLWAGENHNSLALITTRYPLKDLEPYKESYRFITPEYLSAEDARELMRKRGVKGEDEALDEVAQNWEYHALCLTLIAGYLKYYDGDIAHVSEIPFEAMESDKKVGLILTAYKNQLDDAEQAFMSIFSTFRLLVKKDALHPVFCKKISNFNNSSLCELTNFAFLQMIEHLVNLGLINEDKQGQHTSYSTHPLIKGYYYEHLGDEARIRIHQRVAQYYGEKAHPKPKNLNDLTNAIEAFYHLCQAKDYDKANIMYHQRINIIYEKNNFLLFHKLGAFELNLNLIHQFFPGSYLSIEHLNIPEHEKAWLINEFSVCLLAMGQLTKALPILNRTLEMRVTQNLLHNASAVSHNLCETYLMLGNLVKGENAARQSFDFARLAKHKIFEFGSLAWLAYSLFLQGECEEAREFFDQANELMRKVYKKLEYEWIFSNLGIKFAEYLMHSGENNMAEEVTKKNLIICQKFHSINDIPRCYRILAGLNLKRKDYSQAEEYLNEGMQISFNIGLQEEIAKLHLVFARLYLACEELQKADSALKETLSICDRCGYKLIEIDARNVKAKLHQAANQTALARQEAEAALSMSEECGYHWGKIDAQEILN